MGRKYDEVGGKREYKTWKLWNKNDFIVGRYLNSGKVSTKYGAQDWYDVMVEETSHSELKEGQIFRLNGVGSLNSKMEDIDRGSIIKVQYNGYNKLESGDYEGSNFHDVSVFVAASEEDEDDSSSLL